jgi:hypothetical protein
VCWPLKEQHRGKRAQRQRCEKDLGLREDSFLVVV